MKKQLNVLVLGIAAMFGVAACGGGSSSGPSRVETAKVGNVTSTRLGGNYTLDGDYMVAAVEKLTNSANFSKSGKVKTAITIDSVAPKVGDLTPAVLAGLDVFFIGWHTEAGNVLDSAEMAALTDWVNAGGILIATCDDSIHDAVCDSFGYPVSNTVAGPTVPSAVGATHKLFKGGAFGDVSSVEMRGNIGYFAAPAGAKVLGQDQATGNATILERDYGAGTVIFLSDVDMLTTYGAVTPGPDINNDNDRFLGNLFEYATGLI